MVDGQTHLPICRIDKGCPIFQNFRFLLPLDIFGNRIQKCDIGIKISNSIGNTITFNTIEDNVDGISIFYSSEPNIITHNNFINNGIFVLQSSPQTVEGNYWNDYSQKYPEAKEIGSSGKWDIPYQYGILADEYDHQPLVNPVDITDITVPNPTNPVNSPTPSFQLPIGIPSDASIDQIIIGYLFAALVFVIASLAVVGLLVLIFKKKRKITQ